MKTEVEQRHPSAASSDLPTVAHPLPLDVQSTRENAQPYWHLTLQCPHCGSTGVMPWDRLDRMFSCRACATWYRMDGVGRLVKTDPPAPAAKVAVRSAFSDWSEHQLAQRRGWRWKFTKRGGLGWVVAPVEWLLATTWPARAALACVLVGLLASACWLSNRSTAAPATLGPLPDKLEDRAQLLAASWIRRDAATMRRLTLPENGRELQHWSARSLRPSAVAGTDPTDLTFGVVSVVKQADRKSAIATVRIASRQASASAQPAEFVQRQLWNERGGVWYFSPRDVQSQQPAPQPSGQHTVPVPSRRRR